MGATPRLAPLISFRPAAVQWLNGSRFRRHLTGFTTDLMNAPLGGASVEWFNIATDLSVGAMASDALGFYDMPVYVDGLYQAITWKAGTPNVFGSSDRVNPV
jgi:hypothetical protein